MRLVRLLRCGLRRGRRWRSALVTAAIHNHPRAHITRVKLRVALLEHEHLLVQMVPQQAGDGLDRRRHRLRLARARGDGLARRGLRVILRTTKLVPGYLALFLNSPFGLIQSNGFKRGTSPFYLYPRDLKNVLVYVPRNKSGEIDLAWQEKLAANVEASTRAREQAQAKLNEAKMLVEDALTSV